MVSFEGMKGFITGSIKIDFFFKQSWITVFTVILVLSVYTSLADDIMSQSSGSKFWVVGTYDPMKVYCEVNDDVGWTVIMHRRNMDVSFDRNWQDYKDGFGKADGTLLNLAFTL